MNVNNIRKLMQQKKLDAYVVTHGNRFIGQDILPIENKLQKICGFSGSAGILAITAKKAYLLVDGRYELQARQETDAEQITVIDEIPHLKAVCDILQKENLCNIGYDAWNHTVAEMEFIKRRYHNMTFTDYSIEAEITNPRQIKAQNRDLQFSGMSTDDKIQIVSNMLQEQEADFYLFTSADSISWLLNLYSDDLPYSPVIRAYALVSKDHKIKLFADNLIADFPTFGWERLADINNNSSEIKVMYDAHNAPEKIKLLLGKNIKLIKAPDICQLMKTEKNKTELQGMINCHIRDGIALVKLLVWLNNNWQNLREYDVVEKLHEFRSQQQYFFAESFATIAGSGANAAIVHYQPQKNKDSKLVADNLLLLDSGGQYLDGTTDVTRTIVLGNPSKEMIRDFTAVLKAQISLAQAYFPIGTSGAKLDILARQTMWKFGADYKHGTGHGVACFGNVHEGPISISTSGSEFGFKENMITSIEPGIYIAGKYGIRIENLVYTKQTDEYNNMLCFKHLTKVPIDKRLIDAYLLTAGEQAWLNAYHADVYASLAPYLNEIEKNWLKDACSPL